MTSPPPGSHGAADGVSDLSSAQLEADYADLVHNVASLELDTRQLSRDVRELETRNSLQVIDNDGLLLELKELATKIDELSLTNDGLELANAKLVVELRELGDETVARGASRDALEHDVMVLTQANANSVIAVASNRRIGAATGILMARLHLEEEEAFLLLVRASQLTNTKLREVAEQVVRTGETPSTMPSGGNSSGASSVAPPSW